MKQGQINSNRILFLLGPPLAEHAAHGPQIGPEPRGYRDVEPALQSPVSAEVHEQHLAIVHKNKLNLTTYLCYYFSKEGIGRYSFLKCRYVTRYGGSLSGFPFSHAYNSGRQVSPVYQRHREL